MKKIAVTIGDPNSISPEIIIKALNKLALPSDKVLLVGSKKVYDYYSEKFGLKLTKNYDIVDLPFESSDIKIAKETKEAGELSFQAIKKACDFVNEKKIDAIVTGPVSKYAMNLTGHHFAGQTEIIEKYIAKKSQKAEMLFVCGNIKILLLTRHVPVKNLSGILKKDLIFDKIKSLNESLKKNFNIKSPKIALCSLNPHAGENGLFGTEEQSEYNPAISELRSLGVDVEGPFPSDGLFAKIELGKTPYYDCYVASYHDQGLIPIKLLGLNSTVNTTIGLDVLRTSPAHGTAFDIAGKLIASEESMIEAVKIAINS